MIDAHFHCWQLARADYGWLTPELAPIYRDVAVADWQQQALAWGVNGGVLVQAAPTPQETTFLLQQAHDNPCVLGVVGWIDMLAPDAVDQVAQCAARPMLKGLRPMLQDLSDPDWILQPAIQPVLRCVGLFHVGCRLFRKQTTGTLNLPFYAAFLTSLNGATAVASPLGGCMPYCRLD